ncbi:nitrate/nitrite transport system substrate-binding protein [Inquilinus ginsengisoli]|uniref:Nitrate/nitrite transport system substrate-binding protein n=1 Tax=Inquilinus ginsengisoli TaxID=363840 RepID=A0ABU1JHM1_9PROT|nr:CmpA/NrtA family ABC transporter substrate-binding protein [Inquilinus ginsengisoli]MDR6287843.1 nitrate/nitrite transport system substrate-binding protein [Inquilinus ginsengisoli]
MTTRNHTTTPGFSRRRLLQGTARLGGAAATIAAIRAAFPSGAFAEGSGLETAKVALGFIALTDSAPLIIAKEKGLFDKVGLTEASVAKQASWATTRDNLVLGSAGGGIDGAHILTPMPYLLTLGTITAENRPLPMQILCRLNTNGQAISVAKELMPAGATVDATGLKAAFADMKAKGQEVKCAVTFPGGTHDLWMRYWLAAAGIDPNKDVSTIVVPPPQMVANMKVGNMQAFCVGEPWGDQLVHQGIGYSACTTGELWKDHPEKSLALRADWIDAHPKAVAALLQAVLEAQRWAEKPENKEEMAQIIGRRAWFNVPPADILPRSLGTIDYGDGRKVENSPLLMKYWQDFASYPFQSHELWFLTEDRRWGYIAPDTDLKALIAKVNREDLWRAAAQAIGVAAAEIPTSPSRGKETFFDGKVFDPDAPDAYLASLAIKTVA